MKKKQLEIILERLEGFSNPCAEREQYITPATVAAEMLFLAALRGDMGVVLDLGSGTGMLTIGAALMGARAIGVEIDAGAIKIAQKNASMLGVDVDFIRGDVNSIFLKGIDTVIMNPPFGAQKASLGDRAFLCKALKTGKTVYSLHNLGSEGFIRRFVEPCIVEEMYRIPLKLNRCFEFHKKDSKTIEVELYRIKCQKP